MTVHISVVGVGDASTANFVPQLTVAPIGRIKEDIPATQPLTAPAGGTPAPVNLSASWNETTKMADLVWTASDNPNFDHYEIRYHPGPKYLASGEQAVDSTGETEFATDFGLVANGSIAWFKVYVVTSTGNEKGSNAVKVIRTSD